jgi:hypothetical protein
MVSALQKRMYVGNDVGMSYWNLRGGFTLSRSCAARRQSLKKKREKAEEKKAGTRRSSRTARRSS